MSVGGRLYRRLAMHVRAWLKIGAAAAAMKAERAARSRAVHHCDNDL